MSTHNRSDLPFVVGAYASQPAENQGQADYYDLLAATGWVQGLEVPYPGQMAEATTRDFLGHLMEGRFTHSVLTPIPGTMGTMWKNPTFGLASPDDEGRSLALKFVEQAHAAVADMHARHGHIFDYVALHSAPNNTCEADAFAQSIAEISSWDWGNTRLVIEHCDEKTSTTNAEGVSPDGVTRTHTPEKGFLLLDDEIAIAKQAGITVSLNWGRSAVGSRGATVPNQHIQTTADAGVLAGVLFSGAGPKETIYGPGWIDGHLPATTDEPTSLMTEALIDEGAALAVGAAYLGAKCCVPKDATLPQRVEMLSHIHRAAVGEPARP